MKISICYIGLLLLVVLTWFGCTVTAPEDLPAPLITPAGGTFESPQVVVLSCATAGATIRYTTNGSNPSSTSTLYTVPLQIHASQTIKARAFKTGWTQSPVTSASFTINDLLGEMTYVHGGTFNDGRAQITVSDFYLDIYEMTQAGYLTVMEDNPSFFTSVNDAPVDQVSWYKAVEYCNRRSILEGRSPCYSYGTQGVNPDHWPAGWDSSPQNQQQIQCDWEADGYRLPTDAEWEFAARGGNSSQNYYYSGSNTINLVAWYNANSLFTTHPVYSRPPNEIGFKSMSGNVWEWTWNVYQENLPTGPQTDPHGILSGDYRTRRGGAYDSPAAYCLNTCHHSSEATYSMANAGFRVCRNAP
jgi:formylglycine-generating enzyme